MADRRPDPDALLERVQEEERKANRGRLKIFFGASPGVGKTYSMLEDAHAGRREGIDVVAGIIETHGRPETEALLQGLEQLPRRKYAYRGVTLAEFDLEAALARRPGLLLVDELAHSNAPGSRHSKRWQDVEELLAAGISVYTTLNVQHIESLNDVIAQITGIQVRETVPDSVFDVADEIELADLSAEDLLERLRQGKVYVPEQAARALDRFFRPGNLIALRELALRRTAERIDAQMRGYRELHGIHETWPAVERLLVCVGPNPASARLVRAARRMAGGLKCEWIALFVETPMQTLSESDRMALVENLQLAEELGGRAVRLSGNDPVEEILAFARAENVTKILTGKPTHPRWRDKLFGSLLDRLVRGSGDIDVYAISGESDGRSRTQRLVRAVPVPWREYGYAIAVMAVCTLLGRLAFGSLSVTDVAMIYLIGVATVAARWGRGPSLVASLLSIALFDFFFVPPYLTFAISDFRYALTFGVMLLTTLLISGYTHRQRRQAEWAREREQRTAALYGMSRELAASLGPVRIADAARRHISDTFHAEVHLLVPEDGGRLVRLEEAPGGYLLDDTELGVADWVWRRGQRAGLGTDTLPGAKALYLPLVASERVVGVLGIRPEDDSRLEDPGQRRLLDTFADQVAGALERSRLADQSQRARVEVEAERLRTSLLSSLSHDLRTPLGAITGAASSLLADDQAMKAPARRELLETIIEESGRMNRLIGNLLNMIRLEAGALQVQKDWVPLEEPVGVALIRLGEKLADHPVQVELPPDFPLVPLDAVLMEQVFINLFENAMKYTPSGTPVEVRAWAGADEVTVEVADRGPGVPLGEEDRIFEKFYRATGTRAGAGSGLGLTICKGIVTAHGGRIWAGNRDGGGLSIRFTIPLSGPPPARPPVEPEAASPA